MQSVCRHVEQGLSAFVPPAGVSAVSSKDGDVLHVTCEVEVRERLVPSQTARSFFYESFGTEMAIVVACRSEGDAPSPLHCASQLVAV